MNMINSTICLYPNQQARQLNSPIVSTVKFSQSVDKLRKSHEIENLADATVDTIESRLMRDDSVGVSHQTQKKESWLTRLFTPTPMDLPEPFTDERQIANNRKALQSIFLALNNFNEKSPIKVTPKLSVSTDPKSPIAYWDLSINSELVAGKKILINRRYEVRPDRCRLTYHVSSNEHKKDYVVFDYPIAQPGQSLNLSAKRLSAIQQEANPVLKLNDTQLAGNTVVPEVSSDYWRPNFSEIVFISPDRLQGYEGFTLQGESNYASLTTEAARQIYFEDSVPQTEVARILPSSLLPIHDSGETPKKGFLIRPRDKNERMTLLREALSPKSKLMVALTLNFDQKSGSNKFRMPAAELNRMAASYNQPQPKAFVVEQTFTGWLNEMAYPLDVEISKWFKGLNECLNQVEEQLNPSFKQRMLIPSPQDQALQVKQASPSNPPPPPPAPILSGAEKNVAGVSVEDSRFQTLLTRMATSLPLTADDAVLFSSLLFPKIASGQIVLTKAELPQQLAAPDKLNYEAALNEALTLKMTVSKNNPEEVLITIRQNVSPSGILNKRELFSVVFSKFSSKGAFKTTLPNASLTTAPNAVLPNQFLISPVEPFSPAASTDTLSLTVKQLQLLMERNLL